MATKKAKPKKASSAAKSKRKSKVFSVSLSPDELLLVDSRVEAIRRNSGLKFSRNEYMRKVALAANVYFGHLEKDPALQPDFQEIFRHIN